MGYALTYCHAVITDIRIVISVEGLRLGIVAKTLKINVIYNTLYSLIYYVTRFLCTYPESV